MLSIYIQWDVEFIFIFTYNVSSHIIQLRNIHKAMFPCINLHSFLCSSYCGLDAVMNRLTYPASHVITYIKPISTSFHNSFLPTNQYSQACNDTALNMPIHVVIHSSTDCTCNHLTLIYVKLHWDSCARIMSFIIKVGVLKIYTNQEVSQRFCTKFQRRCKFYLTFDTNLFFTKVSESN